MKLVNFTRTETPVPPFRPTRALAAGAREPLVTKRPCGAGMPRLSDGRAGGPTPRQGRCGPKNRERAEALQQKKLARLAGFGS
jgi:hypothetical protein